MTRAALYAVAGIVLIVGVVCATEIQMTSVEAFFVEVAAGIIAGMCIFKALT